MRVGVVGSGIAGMGAAWALARRHAVVLFEAAGRAGGHAHTVTVDDRAVDTGFIVFNERTYPNLVQLFDRLGVATEPSDMSFSVSLDDGAFEYQARGLGLLAQPRNLADHAYRRMIGEITRFAREAPAAVREDTGTTREYLRRHGHSTAFAERFLLPMLACIWSASLEAMLEYPAASMVAFLENHGMLDLRHRPRWRTVSGGSGSYVRELVGAIGDVRTDTAVLGVEREADRVVVRSAAGREDFDEVVLATHADDALRLLGPHATTGERAVLGAFAYQTNRAVLHRDPTLMPRRRRAWSSWNYLGRTAEGAAGEPVSLTYWMNRLQNLRTSEPVFVSLNPAQEPRHVEHEDTYRHPVFDASAVAAQADLPTLQGRDRVRFAGSYHGYGFHEDALRSGLAAAAALGSPAPRWDAELPVQDLVPV
jgi:predicted NAD/FAD-binding protein